MSEVKESILQEHFGVEMMYFKTTSRMQKVYEIRNLS